MHTTLMACLLALAATPAAAETFCVETEQQLRDALATAQANGENDVIKVVRGVYALSTPLEYVSFEDFSLTLAGGYLLIGPSCGLWFPDPAGTVLEGSGASSLLMLNGGAGSGTISVGHFTFRNGIGLDQHNPVFVGGYAGYSGDVTVEDNVFSSLEGRTESGYTAVQISVDQGSLVVRNNLFTGNTTDSGIQPIDILLNAAPIAPDASDVNPNGAFNNNTVTGNGGGYAVGLRGAGFWSAANNVIWGNANTDLLLGSDQHVALYYNDIGSLEGTPGSIDNDVSVDPRFVDAANGDYRLRADSMLIDQGMDAPYGGVGDYDVGGRERVVFDAVDIGGYELQDAVFESGFDMP